MEANKLAQNRVVVNIPLAERKNLSNFHTRLSKALVIRDPQRLRTISEGNYITKFLLLCGIIAPFLMMFIIIIVGWLTPGYSPVSDTISLMGIHGRPYAWVLHGGYFVYGILMSLAAFGLYRRISISTIKVIPAVLINIHSTGTILLAIFPDSLASPLQHIIHDVVSTISYLPLLGSILITCFLARRKKVIKALVIPGIIIILVNLPMPFINILEFLKPVGGLLQRLMSAGSFIWLASLFSLLYYKTPSALPGFGYSAGPDSK